MQDGCETSVSSSKPLLNQSNDTAQNGRLRKQRRPKPTLNCAECVERKTKCDRSRPYCALCIRRRTACHYHPNPNAAAADSVTDPQQERKHRLAGNITDRSSIKITNSSTAEGYVAQNFESRVRPERDTTHQRYAFTQEKTSVFNRSGMSSRHPFSNYWTNAGGSAEVVVVLPTKEAADSLVEWFFQCVDPLYPIILQSEYQAEHERFWSLSIDEKCNYNAAFLALQFVVYALGTQYLETIPPEERDNMTDFYLSASHQSLCLYSYLNRCSLATMQTMILICYVLIGKGYTSDAWTFSGITLRLAYGLELNRRPSVVGLTLNPREEQLRYRLWQAVMFQDTNLSMYLELPPSTLFYDLEPTCLKRLEEVQDDDLKTATRLSGTLTTSSLEKNSATNDILYLRLTWELVSFVQSHLCIPRCRGQSVFTSSSQKDQIILEFRDMYLHWESPFNSYDAGRFEIVDQRLVRQLIAVSSNYFYVLTILCKYEEERSGVFCDVYGVLDAAHEGMLAFFALARICPAQVESWGAYHTRAFSQATMIGEIIAAQSGNPNAQHRDAQLMLARSDFDHYLDILVQVRGAATFEATRSQKLENLRQLREEWVVEQYVQND